MSSELVPTADADLAERSPATFESSLAAEHSAEKVLMGSVVKSVAIAIPLGIAVFVALIGLAVGDQLEWWTILGLGALLGVVAAFLFGMLGGVTLVAHTLDDVDRGVYHEPA